MARKAWAYWKRPLVMSLALVVAAGPSAIAVQSAADAYAQKCAACHGDGGKGGGPAGQAMSPPPGPFSGIEGKKP